MRRSRIGATAMLLLSLWLAALPIRAASAFANPAFEAQWKQGEALAPNFWGPLANAKEGQQEPYKEAPSGSRLVQYFDKGRMELTSGTVTNGLLATELTTGQVQIGDSAFQPMPSPAIPIAGDPDNPGPTYAQLNGKDKALFDGAPRQTGNFPWVAVSPSGDLSASAVVASGPTVFALFDDRTRHNVPKAFAEYRERVGMLTIGLAIAEPFFATVKVAGEQKRVLVQVFERRVLTYTDSNPVAFRVEMGNIGQHYARWRYGGAGASPPAAAPSPAPQPLPQAPPATSPALSTAARGAQMFSGTGTGMTAKFPLSAGLVVFHATSSGGSGAFVAELRDDQGNAIDLAANAVGPSTTSRLAGVRSDGMYLIAVQYDGAWSIEVDNPANALENPIGIPTTLTGAGASVTRALTLPRGLLLVKYTSKGNDDFVAELYDASGAFVDLGADDLPNRTDTRAIQIPSDGTYIFGVVFDGQWTLTLSTG